MDIIDRLNDTADMIANEGFVYRASIVRAGAAEISRQRHTIAYLEKIIERHEKMLFDLASLRPPAPIIIEKPRA